MARRKRMTDRSQAPLDHTEENSPQTSRSVILNLSFGTDQEKTRHLRERNLTTRLGKDGIGPDGEVIEAIRRSHAGGEPGQSLRERASRILERVAFSEDPREIRDAAHAALEVDPSHLEAKIEIATLAESTDEKIALLSRATNETRRKLADVLRTAREGRRGLWEFPEARPFLDAQGILARAYAERGSLDQSIRIQEEIRSLDPGDHLHIWRELLINYFSRGDDRNAERLLDTREDEPCCDSLFGRALLDFRLALARAADCGWSPPPRTRVPFEEAPAAIFAEAKHSLQRAVRSFPWSVLFLIDSRVLGLGPVEHPTPGSPFESLDHARRSFRLWTEPLYPGLWLTSEGLTHLTCRSVEPILIRHASKLDMVIRELDEIPLDLFHLAGEFGFRESPEVFHSLAELLELILVSRSGLDQAWN